MEHILKWEKEERLQAILEYGYLAAQLDNLTKTKRASMVQTAPPQAYVKTGRKRGRPSKAEIAFENELEVE